MRGVGEKNRGKAKFDLEGKILKKRVQIAKSFFILHFRSSENLRKTLAFLLLLEFTILK